VAVSGPRCDAADDDARHIGLVESLLSRTS
jgi:hypothetical protein